MHSENEDARVRAYRGPAAAGDPADVPAGDVPAGGAGAGAEPEEDPHARLEEIDRRLAELRDLLENRPDGPGDQVDAASTLTLQNEITVMVETLENERRRLLERLGEG
ncbi:hypothetical protein GCM10010106_24660 [Thermopolyspora flexuosa]|uniref:Uncharacterized protein n=1 Tax=Thermopolyspora flexuosa TaxID=103836 RepID=A0A543IVH6_9ACTN|nr:hypothetical protein [Thermopolyspora flexuosa]TQM74578.1 hypothetical protein FHX40_1256 [Thermopolyspora flexuosa]GGM77296.1 hypothetical protein GCM10010106_24660 [Thermopolyspora flexuosa]